MSSCTFDEVPSSDICQNLTDLLIQEGNLKESYNSSEVILVLNMELYDKNCQFSHKTLQEYLIKFKHSDNTTVTCPMWVHSKRFPLLLVIHRNCVWIYSYLSKGSGGKVGRSTHHGTLFFVFSLPTVNFIHITH